jgi:hypothetical protein
MCLLKPLRYLFEEFGRPGILDWKGKIFPEGPHINEPAAQPL